MALLSLVATECLFFFPPWTHCYSRALPSKSADPLEWGSPCGYKHEPRPIFPPQARNVHTLPRPSRFPEISHPWGALETQTQCSSLLTLYWHLRRPHRWWHLIRLLHKEVHGQSERLPGKLDTGTLASLSAYTRLLHLLRLRVSEVTSGGGGPGSEHRTICFCFHSAPTFRCWVCSPAPAALCLHLPLHLRLYLANFSTASQLAQSSPVV